jgi:hypothetical protein
MLESRPKNARFQFTLVRLLLAVAVFAAILGGMKPLGQASMPFAVLTSTAIATIVLITGNGWSPRQLLASMFGWVTYGLAIGTGLGFGLLDLRAAQMGSSWDGRYTVDNTLAYVIGGWVVGLLIGIGFDVQSRDSRWPRAALLWAWLLLPLLVLIYPVLRAFFERARE